MNFGEMVALSNKYGLKISKAVHLHDEDGWNKWELSCNGIICGTLWAL